ncbi:MAG: hypothetical protein COA84_07590 [Robiginitomaculum sp.]|nr:MAG: hypothetical protein COA84_07590 [Robiginitomaculum sp.]
METIVKRAIRAAQKRVKSLLMDWEEMKQERLPFETEWQKIGDYILPRRDMNITRAKGSLRTKKLADNKGVVANERLAATLHGFLMSPFTPWVMPNLLERDASHDEEVWFDAVAKRMHAHFSGSASNFRVHMAEDMLDSTAFGSSILFIGTGKSGPTYMSVPLMRSWWRENEQGVIDTVDRTFDLTLRKAVQRYPHSAELKEKIKRDGANESELIEFLHVVQPREGGRENAARVFKNFEDIVIYVEGGEVVDVGGHDQFPYAPGRLQRRSGEAYGYGPGWTALPNIISANSIMEAISRNTEQRADPTMFSILPNARNLIDRRPGAINSIMGLENLGISNINDAIQTLDAGGDVGVGYQLLELLYRGIDFSFYVDWLRPNEGPQKTATEVIDNRDLRLRSMSPLVARLEQEKLTNIVERTFVLEKAAGHFPPMPESLDKHELGFEYRSPVAQAQRQSEVEAMMRTFDFAAVAAQFDPDAPKVLDAQEMLRDAARANGAQAKYVRSRETVAAQTAQEQAAAQNSQELDQTLIGAQALQAGGQGLANLETAGVA